MTLHLGDTLFSFLTMIADIMAALQELHRPTCTSSFDPLSPARARVAYDELLASQVKLALRRAAWQRPAQLTINAETVADADTDGATDGSLARACQDALPYALTESQQTVLAEIRGDMASGQRMMRLVQGDVGSGKTICALLSMLHVVEAGPQTCILAPTEVLATQHYNTISALCAQLNARRAAASASSSSAALAKPVKVALLTGGVIGFERKDVLKRLASGEIDILVGTHAVYMPSVTYKGELLLCSH